MKMSCNGCRVLRKGCTENCCLRPCLQWITSADAQAKATVFLAKFYGRAGLINLISAGPASLRPTIFISLLYEACGRVVNPIYGSAGMMWSGDWQRCQDAVDAVLAGTPILQMNSDAACAEGHPLIPLKGGGIRHFSRDSTGTHRVEKNRNRFKRSGSWERGKSKQVGDDYAAEFLNEPPAKFSITGWNDDQNHALNQATSHDSISVETEEPSLMNLAHEAGQVAKSETRMNDFEDAELLLDLTLGLRSAQPDCQSSVVTEIASDGDM